MTNTRPSVEALARTRDGWHRVAEHVLAAGQYADAGEITLRPAPGGFATTHALGGGRQLRVGGTELVVDDGTATRSTPLSTVREVADFAGVTPGMPPTVYPPATPLDLDAPLHVEAESARVLADWYQLGAAALSSFTAAVLDDPANVRPVLWPEHFDLGSTLDGVDYGASPGDDEIAEPYIYVGAGTERRRGDDTFWNARFGAYRRFGEIASIDDAVAFFHTGHGHLAAGHSSDQSTRSAT